MAKACQHGLPLHDFFIDIVSNVAGQRQLLAFHHVSQIIVQEMGERVIASDCAKRHNAERQKQQACDNAIEEATEGHTVRVMIL